MIKKIFHIKPYLDNNTTSFFFKAHSRFILVMHSNIKSLIVNSFYYFSKNLLYIENKNNEKKFNILKYFLNSLYLYSKGFNQGFFIKLRIVGLGFKIRRVFFKNKTRFLKISLGYSHNIFYKLPKTVNIFIKKRNFFLQAFDFNLLMSLHKRLQILRMPNSYKEKGILLYNENLKLKSGKQQQK
jgi:large subunit ribosomal protein L6